MLYDQIKRAIPQEQSPQRLNVSGYYDPLKLHPPSVAIRRPPDKSMSVQIQRGKVIPKAVPREIDHDRIQQMLTQEHGMKVRLGDKTLEELDEQNQSVISKLDDSITSQQKSNLVLLNTIRRSIGQATAAQIRALANAVGVPITNNI